MPSPRSSSRSRRSPAELEFRTNAVPSPGFPVNTSDDTASDGATDTAAAAGIVGSGVVDQKVVPSAQGYVACGVILILILIHNIYFSNLDNVYYYTAGYVFLICLLAMVCIDFCLKRLHLPSAST